MSGRELASRLPVHLRYDLDTKRQLKYCKYQNRKRYQTFQYRKLFFKKWELFTQTLVTVSKQAV